ncbi:MAG: translation elongation factor Ts [Anaerosomatales bacterium]|nr:translation elongation factor Ts [Anaerosomatales bacterium]MDT8433391.1 translation elongation factor Ts [Anaerosomatales bacterium]
MADITATMVKDLRECTGAGMMDCKKALAEADGDMDAAVDILRTKGLAALAKKAGRATNEGVIGGAVSDDGRTGVLVEVNCETDFVARNASFKSFVVDVASHIAAAAPADVAGLLAQAYESRPEVTVEQFLGETVGKLGENMGIARFARYELASDNGGITVYIHGVGNIGVMAEISASAPDAAAAGDFAAFAKDVAMQIAAAAPLSVRREEVPQATVDHEMDIYKAQAAESGKPEQIQEKIATGRLEKYYKEVCLLEQPFVKDPDVTVKQYLEATAKSLGAELDIVRFERFVLGETASAE